MKKVVVGGILCVRISKSFGRDFGTSKGVRQGDPISPLMFNAVGDVIARMSRKAKNNGSIKGLVPPIVKIGICIVHYADDNVDMFQGSLDMALNVKILLYMFVDMASFKINFGYGR
jgi:hypothetical protein